MSSLYSPLPFPDSIRLLHIFPGTETEVIEAELKVYKAEDVPPYEALSYCWGNPEPSHDILVNGEQVSVGPSLFAALLKIRKQKFEEPINFEPVIETPEETEELVAEMNDLDIEPEEDELDEYSFARRRVAQADSPTEEVRILWVDAICLNQADAQEKGDQVKKMFDIFHRAQLVLIWWGDEDYDTVACFSMIKTSMDARKEEETRLQTKITKLCSPPTLPPLEHPCWTSLVRLLDREWCERVWVIQEASAASSAFVLVGELEIDWDELSKTVALLLTSEMIGLELGHRLFFEHTEWNRDYLRTQKRFFNVVMMGAFAPQIIQKERPVTLYLDLLRAIRRFDSTLQVDRIFSIAGLFPKLDIKSDYDAPAIKAFQKTAKGLILLIPQRSLQIFGDVNHQQGLLSACTSHPTSTWVPLWDTILQHSTFNNLVEGWRDLINACGDFSVTKTHPSPFESSLVLDGSIVSTTILVSGKTQRPRRSVFFDKTAMNRFFEPIRVFLHDLLKRRDDGIRLAPELELDAPALAAVLTAGQFKISSHTPMLSEYFREAASLVVHAIKTGTMLEEPNTGKEAFKKLMQLIILSCRDRRLFLTTEGALGIGPRITQVGDQIAVFPGGPTPFVVRPIACDHDREHDHNKGDTKRFIFAGECYVYGMMQGEVADRWNNRTLAMDKIELV